MLSGWGEKVRACFMRVLRHSFFCLEKNYERMGGLTAKFGIDNIEHTKFSFEVTDHGPFQI